MKKIIIILLLAVIGYFLADIFFEIPFGEDSMVVSKEYLDKSPNDLHVANTVTSIVVNFRGFDTLGEVTVLFLASTAIGSILFRRRKVHTKLNPQRNAPHASRIVQISAKILFPLIVLLGAYVFIHGHLTPGGGFQGGVIIATGYLLLLVTYRKFSVSHSSLTWIEAIAGVTFAGIGVLGLILGKDFLENFLPVGTINNLFSGGIIGIIYVAVGFKVASELTGILDTMLSIKVDSEENEQN
ncbi:MAG: Na(+)/H(+) antiporter subunit B [Bacteroidales bacterium]|nr:Na(+)/H(+) antiporter subunit B [Bacteroidales bacterium]